MRPVNLIPPEERRGESIPLRAGPASYVIVGVLAVALLAVIAVVLTGNSINQKKADLASLQARQQAAQQKAAELDPYTQFATDSQATQVAVQTLADSRFDWHRVLRELSLVLPDDIWLESMTGTVAPGVTLGGSSSSSASDPTIVGPSLHIVGCGRSQDAVAGFLAAMKNIDGVTRVGIASSTLGEATADPQASQGTTATPTASTDCQTRSSVAKFDVTLAFDAVPASAFSPAAADGSTAVAATTTPTDTTASTTGETTSTPATTTPTTPTTTTPTTASDGVSDGQADEQAGNNSSNTQINKAKNGASAVGVGG